jgi:hypothetical protein
MCTHEEAAGILKAAGDTVVLEVQYRPEGNNRIDIIIRFPNISLKHISVFTKCVGPSVKTDEIRLEPVKFQISPFQKSDIVSDFS